MASKEPQVAITYGQGQEHTCTDTESEIQLTLPIDIFTRKKDNEISDQSNSKTEEEFNIQNDAVLESTENYELRADSDKAQTR